MEHEKIIEHKRTVVERSYTCSRCGQPCGPSENKESTFQVYSAEIECSTGQRLEIATHPHMELSVRKIRHVQMVLRDGSDFPEGSFVTRTTVDSCVDCFEKYAIPALQAAGFSVRVKEE